MKTIKILALSILIILPLAKNTHAGENPYNNDFLLGIGVKTIYSISEPAWTQYYDSTDIGRQILTGPLLSLTMFDWFNISYSGVMNILQDDTTLTKSDSYGGTPETRTMKMKITRIEQDATIAATGAGYSFFLGVKLVDVWSDDEPENVHAMRVTGRGFGFGASSKTPLTGNLSYQWSFAGTFMYTKNELPFYYDADSSPIALYGTATSTYIGMGGNLLVSLIYYIDYLDVAFIAGARCNLAITINTDENDSYDIYGAFEKNYSLELSVIHMH